MGAGGGYTLEDALWVGRELEKLDREAEQQERAGRQLDRLDRDLAAVPRGAWLALLGLALGCASSTGPDMLYDNNDLELAVGNAALMMEWAIDASQFSEAASRLAGEGRTVVYGAVDGALANGTVLSNTASATYAPSIASAMKRAGRSRAGASAELMLAGPAGRTGLGDALMPAPPTRRPASG